MSYWLVATPAVSNTSEMIWRAVLPGKMRQSRPSDSTQNHGRTVRRKRYCWSTASTSAASVRTPWKVRSCSSAPSPMSLVTSMLTPVPRWSPKR